MARKKNTTKRLLTDVELEIMTAVWKLGHASVRETIGALEPSRGTAYTTVATIMKILETKGFLESRKTFGVLVYTPRVSRDAYEAVSVRHLVRNVFQGEPSALVNRLLDDESWTPEELAALRERLRELAGGE